MFNGLVMRQSGHLKSDFGYKLGPATSNADQDGLESDPVPLFKVHFARVLDTKSQLRWINISYQCIAKSGFPLMGMFDPCCRREDSSDPVTRG